MWECLYISGNVCKNFDCRNVNLDIYMYIYREESFMGINSLISDLWWDYFF